MAVVSIQDKRNLVAEWAASLKGEHGAMMANLKDNRTVVRTRLTKCVTDVFEIQECLKSLMKVRDDLGERDASIWIHMAQIPAVLEADSDISQSLYFDPCTKIVSLARNRMGELGPAPGVAPPGAAPHPTRTPNPSSKVKLPKIALPIFKGQSPSEFKTFWNNFQSLVDSDSFLDQIQKLQYLQSCCTEEAATIAMRSRPQTDRW